MGLVSPEPETVERKYEEPARCLLDIEKLPGLNDEQRKVLVDAANRVSWDDAIHVAAPWETRSSLCGLWDRNLVPLDGQLPDSVAGCWTCLMAAEWLTPLLVVAAAAEDRRRGRGMNRTDLEDALDRLKERRR